MHHAFVFLFVFGITLLEYLVKRRAKCLVYLDILHYAYCKVLYSSGIEQEHSSRSISCFQGTLCQEILAPMFGMTIEKSNVVGSY